MLDVRMICHLWELGDERPEVVLDRLQGEIGVTGITVPIACPPLARLRLRPGSAGRVFRSSGGLFFAPRPAYYQATRCQPPVAAWLRNRNPLADLAEQCARRDLQCRVVVGAATLGLLASRHPQVAVRNAFDDPAPDRVCLVNPDVQALIGGICRDLTEGYPLTGIELAEFHTGRTGRMPADCDTPFDLGVGGRCLLNICFCASCRQLGLDAVATDRLDAEAAARSAKTRLEATLETGRPMTQTLDQLVADDEALGPYLNAQWHALARCLDNVIRDGAAEVTLHTYGDLIGSSADEHPLIRGGAIPRIRAVSTFAPFDTDAGLENAAQAIRRLAGEQMRPELRVRPYTARPPHDRAPDAQFLVRNLNRLAELGIAAVDLDGYGRLPARTWPELHQAIRFARRTAPAEG
ncbi:MAG: hypothetical protein GY778_25170 [bacterium]|nr:hypothetical protein [bacterium]